MNNYNLEEKVCWNKVLKTLNWNLTIKIENYTKYSRNFNNFSFLKKLRKEIYDSYIAYASLRKFLGYRKITKTELKARDILENIE